MMDDQTGCDLLFSAIGGHLSDYDDLKRGLLDGCRSTGLLGFIVELIVNPYNNLLERLNRVERVERLKRFLDQELHYDFTDISDNGRTFFRGGSIYNRPCGWQRYALKVDGKFTDDIWLNGKTPRADQYSSAEGEWAVSYHGTSVNNGLSIGQEGYKLSKGERFLHGKGIYSTPDIEVATLYAKNVSYHGNTYKFVVQNRVNPKTVIKVDKAKTGVGEYWISPNDDDIRPYGFCIKKIVSNSDCILQ
jgi:hypothetical protein